jgi:hypothetical protein
MEPRPTDLLFSLVVWFAIFSIPASLLGQPLTEYDTGWHIRTGQWIAEHRQVPTRDPFSTLGPDNVWIAYSWLYGLGLHWLVDALGLLGILWYRTLMGIAVTAALFRLVGRREPRLALQAAITVAGSVAMVPLLVSERPGLFSILFSIWTLEAILSLREGRAGWRPWLLPLVYALWANLHIQFVHGLLLLALAWVAAAIDKWSQPTASPGWGKLTLLGILCGLATLANPYHLHLVEVVLTYAQQKETYELFAELQSPEFRQPADWVMLSLVCAAAFTLGRGGKLDPFNVLLLAACAYFAFHARHDVWLVVLASCVVLAGPSREAAQREGVPRHEFPAALRLPALVGVLGLVLTCQYSWQRVSRERLEAELARAFPVAAAGFLEKTNPPGPIYNPIDWGGFLIWRLPGYQVGIDGRAQLHGGPRIKRFMDTWKGLPGWSSDPELEKAGIVLLQRTAPLASLLRMDRRFTVVYEDDLAVIFVAR